MNLLSSIGDTPLVRLSSIVTKSSAEVWIKYEGNNPTGSYKDRMAYGVIRAAMNRRDLKAGDWICEYTGGSTGTSIAFVACSLLTVSEVLATTSPSIRITVSNFIFSILERYGFSVPIFFRWMRVFFAGPVRFSQPWWY